MIYRFPLDGKKFNSKATMYAYIEKNYKHMLSNEMTPARLYFNLKYNKTSGKCVISGKPTKWNEELGRYERFYSSKEVELYKQQFKERMMKKYGKDSLMNDPEHQKKMLDSRSIAIDYKWLDGSITKVSSTYEHDFLSYVEEVYNFKKSDFSEPPTIYYKEDGTTKFYIPDFYIPNLNLIIEIKGSNIHYQERDEARELIKKNATIKEGFNYVQINDKLYTSFNIFFKREVLDK